MLKVFFKVFYKFYQLGDIFLGEEDLNLLAC